MTLYGFHNKLGYVNCKEVLEYDDIYIEALGNRDNCALAGGQLHGVGVHGVGASASMLLHCREQPGERHSGQRGNLQVGMRQGKLAGQWVGDCHAE
jgi:hypothetical protein